MLDRTSTTPPADSAARCAKARRLLLEVIDAWDLRDINALIVMSLLHSHPEASILDDDGKGLECVAYRASQSLDRVKDKLGEAMDLLRDDACQASEKPAPAVDYTAARERLHALSDDAELRDAFERVVASGGELNESFLRGCGRERISLDHVFLGEPGTRLNV